MTFKHFFHLRLGLWALVFLCLSCANAQPKPQTSPLPEAWHRGAFMEIFVRSWRDSNGDGIGDLQGLTQSLDHLQDLGVKGIWLMPITTSADHDHGYATTDFRNIDPDYGTLADFDALIKAAHARGIGVIMDYVLNHSAAEHPFFQDSLRNPQSPYRDWFEWRKEKPTGWDIWGRDPWVVTPQGSYLATFGPHMPDFNMRNPAVVKYHEDSLKFWLDRGIDGFRLDAVPHLIENSAKDWNDQPESRQLTSHFTRLIKSYPGRYVVCEATAEPKAYAQEDICGGAFAFGLENQIAKAAKGESDAIQKVAQYYQTSPHTLASFASNHDQFAGKRLWDQVAGNETHYKLAAATYLLLPGTPFIYYGEEIGMAGAQGLTDDPFIRGPYSWSNDAATAGFTSGKPYRALASNLATHSAALQYQTPNSLRSFYKDLLKWRNARPSLSQGTYEQATAHGQLLSYVRRWGTEATWVVINYSTQPADFKFPSSSAQPRLLYAGPSSEPFVSKQGTIPGQSVQIFSLEP
ncbi:alpha-amylase family glycosyl hydrolase [Limnohabitans sp. 103DPR2]|uniref:alpha-amylase family glycosyl hydrolase n=1 Tax=Limnohabitans sp. 103DPR2 TaxID=1678129 RepID=UPI000706242C|nr:alpha-amylase family glycosyl hydrolase [Limnohabitans sp. 103DPR2]ALK90487.1 Alpha-amylase precursor [Limnohabitans sp. 103DPR2]